MAARTVDRRVQRTRRLLRDALMSLVQEKGFEELSVQDIIDRADVGRATFYAHFDNKEDLLLSGLEELRISLKERQRQALSRGGANDERVLAFTHEMFVHASQHRDVFRSMVGKHSGAAIQRSFHKMLVDLVREEVMTATTPRGAASAACEPIIEFIAGGLFGLVMWWVSGKARPSVEEVNSLFRRLAIPAIRAAS
ncbi:MAG TPA: TetR/AcrR family transcriptional regulator [Vicinamibacterales bacterium]|nr:TetR/AcrR family transcriptional regulator [Vicinamibacterales bacterium]